MSQCEYALTGIFEVGHIHVVIDTLTALAEPNRLRIVELLLAGPRNVGEIGKKLKLRQPQVSKHLRVLKEAGLVDVQARAQERLHELRPEPLRELNQWLERFRRIWDDRFRQLDDYLIDMQTQEKKEKTRGRRKK
jgi:DNA-binding transcriptional ArsR family regulator